MRASSLLAAALLSATPAFAETDPSAVVAAERSFAADGLALGIRQSFLKHSTSDAIIFGSEPVNAQKTYAARPEAPHPPLVWWPLWAGIARSGDLGFTTGPATLGGKATGWYFTVWARQPGGEWKWVYDGGSASAHGDAPPQGSTPVYLTASTGPTISRDQAMRKVRAAEARLAAGATTNAQRAYLSVLGADARVTGSAAAPATTPETIDRELATRASTIAFSPLGGSASNAGDLAWTYGQARWISEGETQRGHYVRIWQSRAEGWRLVFDQILPVPKPAS